MAKIAMSMPGPIWTESGAYRVQPAAVAPPGAKKDATSSAAANGNSQKLRLFRRGKAMSGAPSIRGSCQFANPTKAGMMAPNIMIRPCIEVSWLKNSGRTICIPGWNSSARLVVRIHRRMPPSWGDCTTAGTLSSATCMLFSWLVGLARICGRGRVAVSLGRRRRCGALRVLIGDPVLVVLLGHRLDDDRHEAVFLAAELGAGAAIDAGGIDLEPRVAHESRYGVLFDS